MPGTTRDAIDTVVETDDGPVRFVDTAGMRRKAKIDENTEYYSFVRALQSIDSADVALLVIDATVGITHQDQRLAERIDAAGCPVVVLLNKWETLDAEQRTEIDYEVGQRLHFLGESPVLKISALTGKGVQRLLPALADSIEDYHRRVPTRKVNEVIRIGAVGPARPARRPGALRRAGRHRAADVHPVRQQGAAGHLPALPRAQAPRGVRLRVDPDQDAGPQARQLTAAACHGCGGDAVRGRGEAHL